MTLPGWTHLPTRLAWAVTCNAAVDMDRDAADLDAFDVPDPGEDDLGGEA